MSEESAQRAQSSESDCPVAGAVKPELHPPHWVPTLVRWHHTRIGWVKSWRLALGVLWAGYRHTIFDYATELPGQDDILVARAPLAKFVIVRNPDIARHVLVSNQDNYVRSSEFDLLGVGFGRGLATIVDDGLWQRNRRLVQPIFAKRNVDALAPQMTAAAVAAAYRWQTAAAADQPVDIAAEMNYVTLDIIARTMFGVELSSERTEQIRADFARLLTIFGYGVISGGARPLRWLTNQLQTRGPKWPTARASRVSITVMRMVLSLFAPRTMHGLRRLERFVEQLISDYRTGKIRRQNNLLALLMAAEDPETGYRYSDLEIRDELMTFLGAGFETTASALAWTWYLLSENPDARARLSSELDSALGGREPTVDDVDNLPWTQAVIAEAMRRYPPVMSLSWVAKSDDVLGDYPIKAGTTVAVMVHGMHHNERVWEDPYAFDPTRFLKENSEPRHRRAHIPFGAGKHVCVASGFANLEATLVVASLAQRFEFDVLPGQRVRQELTFTGGPDGNLMVAIRHRPASSPASRPQPNARENGLS